jgi:hypothetical protein
MSFDVCQQFIETVLTAARSERKQNFSYLRTYIHAYMHACMYVCMFHIQPHACMPIRFTDPEPFDMVEYETC